MCTVVQVCLQTHLKKEFFWVICIVHNHYLICKVLLVQNENSASYNFWALVYFLSAFIFRVLLFLERFYFSSAFISRVLLFLERFHFSSAFISRALSFSERFYFSSERFLFFERLYFVIQMWFCTYLFSLSVSQRLFIFSFQEHYSSSYSNFWMRSAQISWS